MRQRRVVMGNTLNQRLLIDIRNALESGQRSPALDHLDEVVVAVTALEVRVDELEAQVSELQGDQEMRADE